MTNLESSTQIRVKIAEFNELLEVANELKLRVKTKQEFHPMSNANGAPLNPYLSASIIETVEY